MKDKEEVRFYHARPLAFSSPEEVRQVPNYEELHFETAYGWLAKELGFYALFLAVNKPQDAISMTGYQNQFRRVRSGAAPAESRNQVLFCYKALDAARFSDYGNWHIILNSVLYSPDSPDTPRMREIDDYTSRLVLKPSWKPNDWLRAARKGKIYVQAHVETLNLAEADQIWCRNQQTRLQLVQKGFEADKIEVKRFKPDRL